MEEWVGEKWHRFITQAADKTYPQAAVTLEAVTRTLQMLFRAGGGDALIRVVPATAEKVGGPRGWLQRIAGQGERAALSSLDDQTLALPPVMAVFPDRQLNRDLYVWLAAQGACHQTSPAGWLADNVAATQRALQCFPGLRARYRHLAEAHLAQRSDPQRLRGAARALEQAVQDALRSSLCLSSDPAGFAPSPRWREGRDEGLAAPETDPSLTLTPTSRSSPAQPLSRPAETRSELREQTPCPAGGGQGWGQTTPAARGADPIRAVPQKGSESNTIAPVWLWLQAVRSAPNAPQTIADQADSTRGEQPKPHQKPTPHDPKRRRAQRTEDTSHKDGLVMFFRAESILSWSEFVRVNRTGDDEDNQDYAQVADDMEELHIANRKAGETLAARVKFDLDLPSASADDLPVGEGVPLPEWDEKQQRLLPDRCRAQRLRARLPDSDAINKIAAEAYAARTNALRRSSKQVRRRFEALRAAPRWQHGVTEGAELHLDAWVRHQVDRRDARHPHGELPPVFSRRVRAERSLATVMLADLSLSTDAYATQTARVIDLVQDSLFVFGDALSTAGDAFEMLGFSSKRRDIRIHELKRFAEPWDAAARQRVAAIKPGFYTRMGAAIRWGTLRLAERPERQRLLLILSDGKPNDLDHYEGRHGLEDTRHAVQAARAAGLTPFCVTIDEQANAYLPRLFGSQGFALVHRPDQLARALTQVYVRLTASVR